MSGDWRSGMGGGRDSDVGFGLLWGVFMFLGYSVLATVMYAVTGGEAFRRNDVTYPATILAYLVAGLLGGILGGVLLPMTVTRRGSVIFGMIVALPVFSCFGWALWGTPWSWHWTAFASVLVCSAGLGGALGYLEWQPPNRP